MNTVLVVGGAGYVGTTLVPTLLRYGYRVRVLDPFYFGCAPLRSFAGCIDIVRADMRSPPEAALQDVDAVVNLGGLSNDPTADYHPEANWALNYEATVALARRCRDAGVPRYIFAGTCSIYDRPSAEPEAGEVMTEAHDVDPVGHYSEAKFAAERALLQLATHGFCVVVLRKGTVFGYSPRMRFDLVVNRMVRDALLHGRITLHGDGRVWRPLVEVRDVAEAYVRVLEYPTSGVNAETFNVVYRNLQIAEVGRQIRDTLHTLGIPCELVSDPDRPSSRTYCASPAKAERRLGYRAQIGLVASVRTLAHRLRAMPASELEHPRYFNIRWMKRLEREGVALLSPTPV